MKKNKEKVTAIIILVAAIIVTCYFASWLFNEWQKREAYVLSEKEFIEDLVVDKTEINEELKFVFDSTVLEEDGDTRYRYKNTEKNKEFIIDEKEEYISIASKQVTFVYTSNIVLDAKKTNMISISPFLITKEFICIPAIGISEDKMNEEIRKFEQNYSKELYTYYLTQKEKGLAMNEDCFSISTFWGDFLIMAFIAVFIFLVGMLIFVIFEKNIDC